jgi:hypothetical protein
VRELLHRERHLLAAQLTALCLLFVPVGNAVVRPLTLGVAAVALLLPRLTLHAPLWLALTALTAWRVIADWPLADNHAYLLSFWCLALALAGASAEPDKVLAGNGRWLIALVFLLASTQKWSSSSYLDYSFFQYTLLTDERFEDFVVLFTGLDYEALDRYRDYLEGTWRNGLTVPDLPADFRMLALLSTWWNLLEQPMVTIAFLVPSASWLGRQRDGWLLLFCVTVYAVAPVTGFGWLLLAMGVAQCRDDIRPRAAYLLTFALLLVYEHVPWALWLVELTQPLS